MLTMTSLEARSQFGNLLESCRQEPVLITRHGKPVSVMISVADLASLPFSVARSLKQVLAPSQDGGCCAMQNWMSQSELAVPLQEDDVTRLVHELR